MLGEGDRRPPGSNYRYSCSRPSPQPDRHQIDSLPCKAVLPITSPAQQRSPQLLMYCNYPWSPPPSVRTEECGASVFVLLIVMETFGTWATANGLEMTVLDPGVGSRSDITLGAGSVLELWTNLHQRSLQTEPPVSYDLCSVKHPHICFAYIHNFERARRCFQHGEDPT